MKIFIVSFPLLVFVLIAQTYLYGSDDTLVLEIQNPCQTIDQQRRLGIKTISWSPDERFIAVTRADDNDCVMYDTITGAMKMFFTLPNSITASAWLGEHLILALKNGQLIKVENGTFHPGYEPFPVIAQLEQPIKNLVACTNNDSIAAYTSIGDAFAVASVISFHRITPSDATKLRSISFLGGNMTCFEWSPTGDMFAFAVDGPILTSVTSPHAGVLPPGSRIIIFKTPKNPNEDPLTKIFYTYAHHSTENRNPMSDDVYSIKWTKNERLLVVQRASGQVEIHDITVPTVPFGISFGTIIQRLVSEESGCCVTQCSLSPDDRYVALGGGNRLILYDLVTRNCVSEEVFPSLSSALDSLSGTLNILTLQKLLFYGNYPDGVDASLVAWAPLSRRIAVALKKHDPLVFFPHALVVFDAKSLYTSYRGRKLREMHGKLKSPPSEQPNTHPALLHAHILRKIIAKHSLENTF